MDENFNLNIFEEIETLEKKFDSLKYTPEAGKLFTYVRGLINQYRNLKGTLPEHQIARKIIDIFPDDLNYMPVKIALKQMAKMNGNKYDLDLVIRELEDVANAQKSKKNNFQGTKKHFDGRRFDEKKTTFKQSSNKRDFVCKNCGQPGHYAKFCRNQRKVGRFCYICGDSSHLSNKCPKNSLKQNFNRKIEENVSTFSKNDAKHNQNEKITLWSFLKTNDCYKNAEFVVFCLDSGSTNHCCGDRNLFDEMKKVESFTFVNSFGTTDKGNEAGKIVGVLDNGKNIVLNDVLCSEKLKANLVSVNQLVENGFKIMFHSAYASILNKNDEEIYRSKFNGSFYEIKLKVNRRNEIKTFFNTIDLWHSRFGHVSKNYLDLMQKEEMVHGLKFLKDKKLNFCHGCNAGNFKRHPVRREMNVANNDVLEATYVLEKLNLDTVGPFEVASRDKYNGFVSVTDQFSRYRWIVLIRSRNEIPEKLISLFENIQKRFGKNIKIIRCDQGTEFKNRRLEKYLDDNGINYEFSAKYTPEQNGLSERSNGLILEKVRSMLYHSKLTKSFWSYAARTAIYILNRTYSKVIGKTPYEIVYNRKPSVKHFRVFGSVGYLKQMRSTNGKLYPRSIPCLMLGYCTNQQGYFVLNLDSRKIETTPNADFDENLDKIHEETIHSAIKEYRDEKTNSKPRNRKNLEEEREVFNYDEIQDEVSLNQKEKTNLNPRVDISEENIINLSEGVRTRNQTKVTRLLTVYQQKFEKYVTPKTFDELNSRNDGKQWLQAYNKEMNKLIDVGKMSVVKRPVGKQVLPLLELFVKKVDNISGEEIFKCRFVARGDLQKSYDVKQLYSPVVGIELECFWL